MRVVPEIVEEWGKSLQLAKNVLRFQASHEISLWVKYRGFDPRRAQTKRLSATINASLFFHDMILVFNDNVGFEPVTYTGLAGRYTIHPDFAHEFEVIRREFTPLDAVKEVVVFPGTEDKSALDVLRDAGIRVRQVKYSLGDAVEAATKHLLTLLPVYIKRVFLCRTGCKFKSWDRVLGADAITAAVAVYVDYTLHGDYNTCRCECVEIEYLDYSTNRFCRDLLHLAHRVIKLLTGEEIDTPHIIKPVKKALQAFRETWVRVVDAFNIPRGYELYENLLYNVEKVMWGEARKVVLRGELGYSLL